MLFFAFIDNFNKRYAKYIKVILRIRSVHVEIRGKRLGIWESLRRH